MITKQYKEQIRKKLFSNSLKKVSKFQTRKDGEVWKQFIFTWKCDILGQNFFSHSDLLDIESRERQTPEKSIHQYFWFPKKLSSVQIKLTPCLGYTREEGLVTWHITFCLRELAFCSEDHLQGGKEN